MKYYVMTLTTCICILNTHSQHSQAPIELKKKRYFQHGKALNSSELKTILTTNPASVNDFNKSKTNQIIGMGFLLSGTTLTLISSIMLLNNTMEEADALENGNIKESNNGPAFMILGLGAGGLIASIPFTISSKKRLKKAVIRFNSESSSASVRSMEFVAGLNSIGIAVHF